MSIEVKYNRGFPIFLILASIFMFYGAVVANKLIPNAITSVILTIVSVLMLTKPSIVVTDKEVHVKNLLGITLKKHPFIGDELIINEKGVFVKEKKIISARFVRKENLDEIKSKILKSS